MKDKVEKRSIIVFEDSSKASWGGGQKITFLVSHILSREHRLQFVDFTGNSRYIQLVKNEFPLAQVTILRSPIFPNLSGYFSILLELFFFLFFWKSNVKKLRQEIVKKNVIIYVTTKKGLFLTSYLNKKYNIPFVYHAHLVEKTNRFFNYYFLACLKKAENILCVSQTVFNSIPLHNKLLLYNPNKNNRGFKGNKTDRKFVVAAVGSLIKIKGFEDFILAALDSSDEIEFRIYGEGYLKPSLEKLARGRVKFMGFVPDIVSEMYSSIDLIIVPTVIKEALSLVILEAKSVGIPVITTNIGGQAEIVEDSVDGFKVPVKNPISIANKIRHLTSDLDLYNKMAMASYHSISKFNFNSFQNIVCQTFSK